MIITISGFPGAGKSTVSKRIAEELLAERIYVGGIRREIAKEKGMTLPELNEYAKTHPETDVDVDKKVASKAKEIAAAGKDVVVEGVIQFHFLPESIKIFMKVDLEEGARRIWQDLQDKESKEARNEGEFASLEAMKQRVINRVEEDAARYKRYYGVDHRDELQYDFVIDTTDIPADVVVERILAFIRGMR